MKSKLKEINIINKSTIQRNDLKSLDDEDNQNEQELNTFKNPTKLDQSLDFSTSYDNKLTSKNNNKFDNKLNSTMYFAKNEKQTTPRIISKYKQSAGLNPLKSLFNEHDEDSLEHITPIKLSLKSESKSSNSNYPQNQIKYTDIDEVSSVIKEIFDLIVTFMDKFKKYDNFTDFGNENEGLVKLKSQIEIIINKFYQKQIQKQKAQQESINSLEKIFQDYKKSSVSLIKQKDLEYEFKSIQLKSKILTNDKMEQSNQVNDQFKSKFIQINQFIENKLQSSEISLSTSGNEDYEKLIYQTQNDINKLNFNLNIKSKCNVRMKLISFDEKNIIQIQFGYNNNNNLIFVEEINSKWSNNNSKNQNLDKEILNEFQSVKFTISLDESKNLTIQSNDQLILNYQSNIDKINQIQVNSQNNCVAQYHYKILRNENIEKSQLNLLNKKIKEIWNKDDSQSETLKINSSLTHQIEKQRNQLIIQSEKYSQEAQERTNQEKLLREKEMQIIQLNSDIKSDRIQFNEISKYNNEYSEKIDALNDTISEYISQIDDLSNKLQVLTNENKILNSKIIGKQSNINEIDYDHNNLNKLKQGKIIGNISNDDQNDYDQLNLDKKRLEKYIEKISNQKQVYEDLNHEDIEEHKRRSSKLMFNFMNLNCYQRKIVSQKSVESLDSVDNIGLDYVNNYLEED